MKRKVLISLITISLLIEGALIYHLFSSSNKVLEEVKIVNLKNDKSIAIMVQNANTDEWHEADNRDSWPSPTTHGFVGAECSDSEGAPIDWEKVLTFDLTKQIATIKTNQTAYCTLYFAKGEPALDWLKKKGGDTFAGSEHTTVVDGMYRFVGTNTQVLNNYICFGTTVESQCLNDAKTYMYRIIGITSTKDDTLGIPINSLKLIKATPLTTSQSWESTYLDDIKWDGSDMKSYLNEIFYNSIKNTQPNGSYWDSIILSHKWYIKDQTSVGTIEPKDAQNISNESKIGLMYATDYKNAGVQNTTNWLFIANGWTGNTSTSEWTMTRKYEYDMIFPQAIDSGKINGGNTGEMKLYARPVFYLQSGVNLIGEGSKDHPFIISGVMPQN